jgi:hypothetical protein
MTFIPTSLRYGLFLEVQAEIQALITADKLPGLQVGSVAFYPIPMARFLGAGKMPPIPFPAIVISAAGGIEENPEAGSNARDDLTFPILIEFIQATNQVVDPVKDDQFCQWTEECHSAMRHKYTNPQYPTTLPGGVAGPPQFSKCDVSQPFFLDLEAWLSNYSISQLVLRFTSRLQRGS